MNNYSEVYELYHHGIKGMKWGIRRFQNRDGTYTAAGKARRSSETSEASSPSNSSSTGRPGLTDAERAARVARAKKALMIVGGITVAAAAAYVAANPKTRKVVVTAAKKIGSVAGPKAKSLADKGKNYVKSATSGFKEGLKEGVKEGPKKFAKSMVVGMTMLAGKQLLDYTVGPDTAGQMMKANNPKKIDSFWRYTEPTKRDDEDDD